MRASTFAITFLPLTLVTSMYLQPAPREIMARGLEFSSELDKGSSNAADSLSHTFGQNGADLDTADKNDCWQFSAPVRKISFGHGSNDCVVNTFKDENCLDAVKTTRAEGSNDEAGTEIRSFSISCDESDEKAKGVSIKPDIEQQKIGSSVQDGADAGMDLIVRSTDKGHLGRRDISENENSSRNIEARTGKKAGGWYKRLATGDIDTGAAIEIIEETACGFVSGIWSCNID